MAKAMIWGVAKRLDNFVEEGKLWAVDGEFYQLRKTVSILHDVVHDAENRIFESPEIEAWLDDLEDAFYDADDLLEEWNDKVIGREPPSKFENLKRVIPFYSPSNELALGLKSLRERLEAIAVSWYDVQIVTGSGKIPLSDSSVHEKEIVGRDVAKSASAADGAERATDSFLYEEEIIGREDDKSAILNFLLFDKKRESLLDSDPEEEIFALSICGVGAIGKTALARCLYKDDMVNKHFDLRIWVSVGGDRYDPEMVLQKIVESVTTERADNIGFGGLQNQLIEHIRGKKYLLVLDDVWLEFHEEWRSLKSLLMGGAQGSKILITTGRGSVAHMRGTSSSYFLEALSETSSLDLLIRVACKDEEMGRYPNKLLIGRKIVEKCHGIPLAIRAVGSILFFKKSEAEWLHLERQIQEVGYYPELFPHLDISYNHLPYHLQLCFTFCSLFPSDWVIDKLMLTSLWIAEGLIEPKDNLDWDLEDIAHDYFMDLLRRNFFQDCTTDGIGNITSCKMHRSMNGLACMVAKPEYSQDIDLSWPSIDERTYHVSWGSTLYSSQGLPATLLGAKNLRTFIKTDIRKGSWRKTRLGETAFDQLISSFKLLHVLDWHDNGIKQLPSSICRLQHLTFLDLSENEEIIRLPDTMTRLQNLQVLKLNLCYKLIELPGDIRKLVNLRQLEISNCNALSHMPCGLSQLTLLHTLTDFLLPGDGSRPKNCGGLGELNRLSNLRGSLRVEVKGEIADTAAVVNAANLKEKDSLVSLVLQFAGKEIDEVLLEELQPSLNLRRLEIRGYGGTRFPSWMSHMPKLVELKLFHCAACKSLPPLGELTSLKLLEIGALPIVKCTKSDIHALSSLPDLSVLRIHECPYLEWIPPLLHLKELELPDFPLELLQTSVATIEQVIGIDDQVKEIIELMKAEDHGDKPRMIGIHGTNGIGKTTIAKAVYNQLSSCYDSCSFLANIGETAQNAGGIHIVQTKLIHDILKRDADVASFEGGIKFFLDAFSNIKALIVLDDVEEQSNLDDLVGNQLDWFGPGSQIIVTSENHGILETCFSRVRAGIYKVNEMNNDQALELFRRHALIPWYPEIGKRIVKATRQVPLVIEVIGSLLRGKPIEDWRKMEDSIKPHSQGIFKDFREILKMCYEALDEKQKQIFWDITWFANGVDSRIASYMWPDLDHLPPYQVLMPLAKIGEDNMLWMHKLLKRLGRTIDQEAPKYPGKRRRLYMHDPDLKVIDREEEMEKVEAICFDFKNLHPHTFTETLPNVRFLKLDHASMTGNFANVFPRLRWLHLQGCPRDSGATELYLTELVILDLSWSKVTEGWAGWRTIKMEQLKVLNLTGCTDLLISPRFCSIPNLEILILEQCSRLVRLDPSVGCLKKLLCLNLKSCTLLNMLPVELGELEALKELLIDGTSVRDISWGSDSKKLEHLTSLSVLSVDNSKITKLPDGVGELVKLRRLSLRNCHWIRELPDSIGQLGSSLEELDISGTGISKLPDSFGNLLRLRVLKMDYCFISEFPGFIWRLNSLEEIHASSCRNLEGDIPGDIRELKNLRILRLQDSAISSLPPEIKHLPKLQTRDPLHCDMLAD